MIYSFHHFYYWIKGGVETGQAYRAKIFRNLGMDAKFVFATTFPNSNIWKETEYLGFLYSETLWLYGFFTDCKNSAIPYTLEQLESTFDDNFYNFSREGAVVKYSFVRTNSYYLIYMLDEESNGIQRVEIISNGRLIQKDFYTYCKIYSEFYVPQNNQPHLVLRRFYHENGSVAYEELIEDDVIMYKFSDRILYSREELVGYMMSCLNLTEEDIVLLDGEPGMIERSAFILNAAPAKVGLIVHADHYLESDEDHIYWYGIYEYAFSHAEKIDFFITNTDVQSNLLREQLIRYKGIESKVLTIPVVGLDKLRIPQKARKKHSLISAGRLAKEKKMDWVIEAVVEARKQIPDLSLDIYGEGGEEEMLQKLIDKLECREYVHLCGFQNLEDLYQKYDAYVSASFVETFGVTLLEAVGSGLPIVGFDIRYGAQVFIDEGKNGYKVPWGEVKKLSEGIVRLFSATDLESFRRYSYEKARSYLEEEVVKEWRNLLCQTE